MPERLTWDQMAQKYPDRWLALSDCRYYDSSETTITEAAVYKVFDSDDEYEDFRIDNISLYLQDKIKAGSRMYQGSAVQSILGEIFSSYRLHACCYGHVSLFLLLFSGCLELNKMPSAFCSEECKAFFHVLKNFLLH